MQTRAFRCQPESVAAARRFVQEALGAQPAKIADAAELMVSELATNCVRHAQTDFEVTIGSGREIRVEVRDTGSGRPTVLSPSSQEPSGRGLLIVESVASTWGVIPSSAGKTVWFTLSQQSAERELPTALSAQQADGEHEGRRTHGYPRGGRGPRARSRACLACPGADRASPRAVS